MQKLCAPKASRDSQIVQLTPEELDRIRALPSFRKFVESNPKERAVLLIKDKPFICFLMEALDEVDHASRVFNVFVSCLHALTKGLPGTPFGKQMYSVYRTALLKPVVESHEYREAFQHLGMSHLFGAEEQAGCLLGVPECGARRSGCQEVPGSGYEASGDPGQIH